MEFLENYGESDIDEQPTVCSASGALSQQGGKNTTAAIDVEYLGTFQGLGLSQPPQHCQQPARERPATMKRSSSILSFVTGLSAAEKRQRQMKSEKMREAIDLSRSIICEICGRGFRARQYIHLHKCDRTDKGTSAAGATIPAYPSPTTVGQIHPFVVQMDLPLSSDSGGRHHGGGGTSQSSSELPVVEQKNDDHHRSTDDEDDDDNRNHRNRNRKSYSLSYKINAVELLNANASHHACARIITADALGIDPSLLSRWKAQETKLLERLEKRRSLANNRRLQPKKASHFPREEARVMKWFRDCRQKGMAVSGKLLRFRMKAELKSNASAKSLSFKASEKWLRLFVKRHGLSWRVKTNSKSLGIEDRLPRIRRWHARLRRRLGKDDPTRRGDPKWGRWIAENRYNLDQVCTNVSMVCHKLLSLSHACDY